MGCRVGMSTTPYTRIEQWKEKEGHTGGEILANNLTHDQAQAREKTEAAIRGYTSIAGGARQEGSNYSVYHVWGGDVS